MLTSCTRSRASRLCLFVNLAFLFVNISLFVLRHDGPLSQFFAGESVSRDDRQRMMDMFTVMIEALDRKGITYFMYGGTLIGSLRHHGMIPWDDDVDIMVAANNRSALEDTLKTLSPDYALYRPSDSATFLLQWKLYPTAAPRKSWIPHSYRWPYIDIFFFVENDTHIWDMERMYQRAGFVWPKAVVFPLVRRPFGSVSAAAPCNSISFVSNNYAGAVSSVCTSSNFNHQIDLPLSPWHSGKTVNCSSLWHIFPFVFRSELEDGTVIETLKIGNWTLQSVVMSPKSCSG